MVTQSSNIKDLLLQKKYQSAISQRLRIEQTAVPKLWGVWKAIYFSSSVQLNCKRKHKIPTMSRK